MVDVVQNSPANANINSAQNAPRKINISLGTAITIVAIIPSFLLTVTFVLLNFYNIFKIDNIFPVLSFLPHLARSGFVVNKTTKTQEYQYDLAGGQVALRSYLSDMLVSSAMPSKNDAYIYASVVTQKWDVSNLNFSAVATYSFFNHSETRDSLGVLFSVPTTQLQGTLTANSAFSFLQKVFKNPPSVDKMHCITVQGGTICENFTAEKDVKNGLGAAYIVPPAKLKLQPELILFSCRYYEGGLQFAKHSHSCVDS